MKIIPPTRKTDNFGSGAYLAPRGSRQHRGVDKACYPGSIVLAVRAGKVTKIGYPYGGGVGAAGTKEPYRYVEVTDCNGYRARYFYVEPAVNIAQIINEGGELGVAQSLDRRHKGITEHVHFEVMNDDGYVNPDMYLSGEL